MEEELLYTQEDIDEWAKTCEELQDKIKEQEETIEQLLKYKRLEEQGLIVRLPFKVGDKFWYVNSYLAKPRIEEYQVRNFEICIYNLLRVWATETSCFIVNDEYVCFSLAEAKKKFKELKGEE